VVVVVSLRNPSFPGFFFVHEHFTRFLTTVHQRAEPWWYFLPLLLLGVLRGCAPARPAAAPGRGRHRRRDAQFKPLKFLADLRRVTLVFFSAPDPSGALHPAMLRVAGGVTGRMQRPGRVRRHAPYWRGLGGGHCGGDSLL